MITLTKRLRQESDGKPTKTKKEDSNSRVSIRDKLLVKEVRAVSDLGLGEICLKLDIFRSRSWRNTNLPGSR